MSNEPGKKASKALPSAEAIDDLDRLAMLLWRLTPRRRQLLWACACRVQWAELCRRQQRSRTTLARDYRLALKALAMASGRQIHLDIRQKIGYFLLYAAPYTATPTILPKGRR